MPQDVEEEVDTHTLQSVVAGAFFIFCVSIADSREFEMTFLVIFVIFLTGNLSTWFQPEHKWFLIGM